LFQFQGGSNTGQHARVRDGFQLIDVGLGQEGNGTQVNVGDGHEGVATTNPFMVSWSSRVKNVQTREAESCSCREDARDATRTVLEQDEIVVSEILGRLCHLIQE